MHDTAVRGAPPPRLPPPRLGEQSLSRRVLLLVAFAAHSVGLLATSAENYYQPYTGEWDGPPLTLTAAEPSAVYRVRVRAEDLATDGQPTTSAYAVISIAGKLVQPDDSPLWVRADVGEPGGELTGKVTVISAFTFNHQLTFQGSCEDPADGDEPCVAEFDVSFEREDAGEAPGAVAIEWALTVNYTHRTSERYHSAEPIPLPWSVEVAQP